MIGVLGILLSLALLMYVAYRGGAILGRLMADSGSASAIAKWIVGRLGSRQAVLAIVLACAVLTYGGVSVLVVIFAAYPVAVAIFRSASTPKRFIPVAVLHGGATFIARAWPQPPARAMATTPSTRRTRRQTFTNRRSSWRACRWSWYSSATW
jgi:H+/gluconate symporter-like permease